MSEDLGKQPGGGELGSGAGEYADLGKPKGLSSEDEKQAQVNAGEHVWTTGYKDHMEREFLDFHKRKDNFESAVHDLTQTEEIMGKRGSLETEMYKAEIRLKEAQDAYDANLWRAKQHVDEHLPEYKQTADQMMQAETDDEKKFVPRADDAGPV